MNSHFLKKQYIYAKLCKILSYDPIYYINNKTQNHIEVKNIENYDLSNNNIVCYELSYILSDLLREIGVNIIKEKDIINEKFSNHHVKISYLVEDIAISADSTTSVNEGDLTQLKYTNELNGIICKNYNKESQDTFRKTKEKVKAYLAHQNAHYKEDLPSKDHIANLNKNQRIVLFNNYLTTCELVNADFISYANKLISILDLNIDTKIFYDTETESRLLLNIEFITYDKTGNIEKISYTIDSVDKCIYDQASDIFTCKEALTQKRPCY